MPKLDAKMKLISESLEDDIYQLNCISIDHGMCTHNIHPQVRVSENHILKTLSGVAGPSSEVCRTVSDAIKTGALIIAIFNILVALATFAYSFAISCYGSHNWEVARQGL